MKKFFLMAFVAMASLATVNAQITTPQPSPASKIEQKVGITDVTLSYARPSVKGRKIFGDLIAYNEIWRFGANSPTKIKFSDSVKVGNTPVAPGEYAMYAIPNANEWTIFLGADSKVQAWDFDQSKAVAKLTVRTIALNEPVETFTFNFADLSNSGCNLEMMWEKTKIQIPIGVDVDKKVIASINNAMNDISMYWQAANYYYETNRDMKQALSWVDKVIEKNPAFWTLHLKAKIQQKMGDCKNAVATAEKSLDAAKKAKNRDYTMMNEKLIASCKGKK